MLVIRPLASVVVLCYRYRSCSKYREIAKVGSYNLKILKRVTCRGIRVLVLNLKAFSSSNMKSLVLEELAIQI